MHGFAALGDVLTHPALVLGCVLWLAGLFASAGLSKLRHPYVAAAAAVNFRVARRPRKAVGLVIGAVELAIAVALLASPRPAVAIVACVLGVVFFVVIALALGRGERFPCGCFGDSVEEIGPAALVRSGLMIAAGMEIALVGRPEIASIGLWSQGAAVAALALGLPILMASMREIRAATLRLDDSLDWEWILQRRYPELEGAVRPQPPQPGRSAT